MTRLTDQRGRASSNSIMKARALSSQLKDGLGVSTTAGRPHTIRLLLIPLRSLRRQHCTGFIQKMCTSHCQDPSNIRKMKDKLADSPHRSSRRLSRELHLSRTTVKRIFHDYLNLFSYTIHILQKQNDLQKEKRVIFSNIMAEKIEIGEIDVLDIDCSDEAHFNLN